MTSWTAGLGTPLASRRAGLDVDAQASPARASSCRAPSARPRLRSTACCRRGRSRFPRPIAAETGIAIATRAARPAIRVKRLCIELLLNRKFADRLPLPPTGPRRQSSALNSELSPRSGVVWRGIASDTIPRARSAGSRGPGKGQATTRGCETARRGETLGSEPWDHSCPHRGDRGPRGGGDRARDRPLQRRRRPQVHAPVPERGPARPRQPGDDRRLPGRDGLQHRTEPEQPGRSRRRSRTGTARRDDGGDPGDLALRRRQPLRLDQPRPEQQPGARRRRRHSASPRPRRRSTSTSSSTASRRRCAKGCRTSSRATRRSTPGAARKRTKATSTSARR